MSINFQEEIKLIEKEFFNTSNETITNRINTANKSLQQAIKGTEPQSLDNDELTKVSSKRLSGMIIDKIWQKKK